MSKYRNRVTGLVTHTDRELEYPWELVDPPTFEPETPYDDVTFDEEE